MDGWIDWLQINRRSIEPYSFMTIYRYFGSALDRSFQEVGSYTLNVREAIES